MRDRLTVEHDIAQKRPHHLCDRHELGAPIPSVARPEPDPVTVLQRDDRETSSCSARAAMLRSRARGDRISMGVIYPGSVAAWRSATELAFSLDPRRLKGHSSWLRA
jgi:hypothetical protein